MTLAGLELKKTILEKEVQFLEKQYTAVSDQLLYENNKATQLALEKHAEELLKNYDKKQLVVEQVKKALAQREQSQAGKLSSRQPSNRHYLHWEEHLCKIDFAKVSKLIPKIIRNEPQGAAAVFLLHDSYRMCGELCLRHITKYLADLSAEPPRHIEIGFSEYETPSAQEFLRRIGKYQEIPTEAGLNTLVKAIIEKICSGLGTAGTVLIELKIRESLDPVYEEFVVWFLCSFWEPLVNRLPQITAERRYIKLIALIHVRNPVPKKALSLYRCTPKEFHGTKLLDLPLEKWELRDIKAWLFQYSGSSWTTEQIEKAATVIHQKGKWPNDVCDQIREMQDLQIEKAEEEY